MAAQHMWEKYTYFRVAYLLSPAVDWTSILVPTNVRVDVAAISEKGAPTGNTPLTSHWQNTTNLPLTEHSTNLPLIEQTWE